MKYLAFAREYHTNHVERRAYECVGKIVVDTRELNANEAMELFNHMLSLDVLGIHRVHHHVLHVERPCFVPHPLQE